MIVRFTGENILSFNKETEFNMLTGDIRRLPEHVFKFPKVEILKSAIIYGANGAGKSNLFAAISILRSAVLEGHIDIINPKSYFRLGKNENKASTFEIEFIKDKVGYAYGLSIYKGVVKEEWLYVLHFGKKEDELIFERKSISKGKESLKLSSKYTRSPKEKILVELYEEELLKPNNLFIHLAKDKKFKEITAAFQWFEDYMYFVFPKMGNLDFIKLFLDNNQFKVFLNETISNFETGIKEIEVQSIPLNQYFGEDNIPERDRILRAVYQGETLPVGSFGNAIALLENGQPVVKKIISYHENDHGELVEFDLSEESDGTLRLIDFIPLLYLLIAAPVTIFIDEVDQSIHPSLLKDFITKIQQTPTRNGQIIMTTHESNLLDLDLFRQDEIWLVEKNQKGESHFYPLSDFNIRPDLDVRKGYLSGRFGAIPLLANLKDLNWEKYAEAEQGV